jgi:hypothetical protein
MFGAVAGDHDDESGVLSDFENPLRFILSDKTFAGRGGFRSFGVEGLAWGTRSRAGRRAGGFVAGIGC